MSDDEMLPGLASVAQEHVAVTIAYVAQQLHQLTGFQVVIVATNLDEIRIGEDGEPRCRYTTISAGTPERHETLTEAAEAIVNAAKKSLVARECDCAACEAYTKALDQVMGQLQMPRGRPAVLN